MEAKFLLPFRFSVNQGIMKLKGYLRLLESPK